MITPPAGYSTTCRICGKEITRVIHPLDVPLEGQPDYRTLQYLSLLSKHISKRHPEQQEGIEASATEYGAMLLVACFTIEDPSPTARAMLVQDAIVNQFAPRIDDAELDRMLDRAMSANQSGEKILHQDQAALMLRALRDLLTCRGRYAPKTAAPPAIIAP